MYYEQLSVQQVDYPHGCYAHHEAALHMVNDEYDCELHSVVCVRAVLHFAHLWQRKAKRKLLRRQAAHHVLLLCWAKKLMPLIAEHIYVFAQPHTIASIETQFSLDYLNQMD